MIPLRNIKRFAGKAFRQPGYAANVFTRRMRAALSRRFGRGRSSMPEALTVFLTHRCNLRCRMCGQWGDRGVTRAQPAERIRQELAKEQLLQFIGEIASFRPNITLFGGEPLLHPYCLDVIRAVKEHGMHCLMITNGSMLADRAGELVESGLDELNVSIDGDEELHDRIRGMPGLWRKIMRGLQEVNRSKQRMNKRKPLVNIQCTISGFNYRQLEQLPGVCLQAAADSLTFHHLIFLEKDLLARQKDFDHLLHCSSRQWEGFVLDGRLDARIIHEQMQKIRLCTPRGLRIDFYPNFDKRELMEYYADGIRDRRYACASPWVAGYVFPDGELRPCLNFDYSFGNIQDALFPQIWNSPQAVRFRHLLKEQRVFPVCKRCTELYRY